MPAFEVKDLFQFGVPTVLLAIALWKGVPVLVEVVTFLKDWLNRLIITIDAGFARIEMASKERDITIREGFVLVEAAAKERDGTWREMLTKIHEEDREDREKERALRHESVKPLGAALLELQDTREQLAIELARARAASDSLKTEASRK